MAFTQKTNKKTFKQVTADYTLNNNDEVIFCDASGGDVTITVPERSELDQDSFLHEFWIYKGNSTNKVIIQLDGTETFPLGYTKIELLYAEEFIHIGGNYNAGWSKISTLPVWNEVERFANWAASNFSTATAVPFDTNTIDDNDEIFEWDSPTNPTRLICKVPVRINASYTFVIDSTGGGTWNTRFVIRKNGTTEIAGTDISTGNFGGEDQSGSMPQTPISMATDDYIELVAEQTNLTGNLFEATLKVQTII